jgi:hypothetical protein
VPTIDEYSVAAIPIEMFFNSTPLSLGTAFLWEKEGKYWLITNWHNLSGRDPNTGKHLSPKAAEPNKIRAWLNVKGKLGDKAAKEIDVRSASGSPLWLVHPSHKNKIDVVALPIQNYTDVEYYPINKLAQMDLQALIGMDVFILGYPFGIGPGGLPIWKRGSMASEPDLAGITQLHLFVDTASRPGMSGSPVIRRSWTTHTMANGGTIVNGLPGTKFIGVYSGRLTSNDPLDAQLGLTWPAPLVPQVVSGVVDT